MLFFRHFLLLKIEPSEITPFFYNSFFGFRGGGLPHFPPWLRPCVADYRKQKMECNTDLYSNFVKNVLKLTQVANVLIGKMTRMEDSAVVGKSRFWLISDE